MKVHLFFVPQHDFSGTKQVVLSEAEEHLWMVYEQKFMENIHVNINSGNLSIITELRYCVGGIGEKKREDQKCNLYETNIQINGQKPI